MLYVNTMTVMSFLSIESQISADYAHLMVPVQKNKQREGEVPTLFQRKL